MANHGANTNGSQFFIMHQDFRLDPQYVIFAHVTKGLDVIDALAETPTTMGEDRQMSRPLTPPTIKTIRITP
jgi:cyclophilin family peptidyl-prolyl cis-trans isomerase